MVFYNKSHPNGRKTRLKVTILILIDGFLQFKYAKKTLDEVFGHNPYFNRWFSAIKL